MPLMEPAAIMATSPQFALNWKRGNSNVTFDCLIRLNLDPPSNDPQTYATLDWTLTNCTKTQSLDSTQHNESAFEICLDDGLSAWTPLPTGSPATQFLEKSLHAEETLRSNDKFLVSTIEFVVPNVEGYVIRSDFLERRLQGFANATQIKSFLSPGERIKPLTTLQVATSQDVLEILECAIGALALSTTDKLGAQTVFQMAQAELRNRISFPWFSSEPISAKRLVWVEGRPDFEFSRRMYEAAWALGITLVIIDNPGHWMEQDVGPHAYLREAFIPVNISVDEGFVERIVNAVKDYGKPVDSIMSVSDARVPGVAKACELLGFPTSPSDSYILAADKFKTRLAEIDDEGSFKVNSVDELRTFLAQNSVPLKYPLIAKPCMGWGSECISKVYNEFELIQAVEKASDRHAQSPQRRTDVMIEPFIEGPEVDANFVLLDGDILFYEIADDFPSPGDNPESSWEDNFQETANLLPCGLPQEELIIIRDSIHQSLLRQGFRTGTFHCEGRVRYSSLSFATKNGREDLFPASHHDLNTRQPEFYLHEINARPAGYLESVATHLTYGIDYYALQILYSLGDLGRYRALSQPFLNGPQWWLVLLIIPEDRVGTMKTEDAGKELLTRDPILAAAVPDYKTVQKKGAKLGGPKASSLSYLAYFSVVSRTSRADALDLAERIRRGYNYEIEED